MLNNYDCAPEIIINAVIAHKDNKQVCFGVVSSASNNTGSNIGGVDIITKNGYTGVYEPVGVPYRKAVTIELPEGVHYGYYAPAPTVVIASDTMPTTRARTATAAWCTSLAILSKATP